MKNEIAALKLAISDDYQRWTARALGESLISKQGEQSQYLKDLVDDFEDSLEVSEGSKYIKIIRNDGNQRSVWGFIVKSESDSKFLKGDILMAAGWAAPARNKPRGNLFTGYNVQWTGPNYLK